MKYKYILINFLQIVFFVFEWVALTLGSGYDLSYQIDSIELFNSFFMLSGAGYTNLELNVGFCVTAFYCIILYGILKSLDIGTLIYYGRDKFMVKEIKKTIVNTLFFVLEFVIVNIIFCMIFCDFSLLIDTKFYICNLLFFITVFMYFLIVGITMLLFRSIMNFTKFYPFLTAIIFCVLTSIAFYIKISPVYYADFIDEWFVYNTFDILDYCINIGKVIIIIAILITANRLVFSRKDIILNEEQD